MDCLFCAIAAGDSTAVLVHQTADALAFLPRAGCLAPGHTLVVPRRHAADLFDVADEDMLATMTMVRSVADAMVAALGAGGVNVLNASGPHSEQSVFHFHFHVIPRWVNDGWTNWPTQRSQHEPIENVADLLHAWLDSREARD